MPGRHFSAGNSDKRCVRAMLGSGFSPESYAGIRKRGNPVVRPFVRFRLKRCRNRAIIYSCGPGRSASTPCCCLKWLPKLPHLTRKHITRRIRRPIFRSHQRISKRFYLSPAPEPGYGKTLYRTVNGTIFACVMYRCVPSCNREQG